MTLTEAKEKIERLRHEIEYHSHRYYVMDEPEISDFEYDSLQRELRSIESEYPQLLKADSPTQRVGGSAQTLFSPVAHSVKMESLLDAFSFQELYSYS